MVVVPPVYLEERIVIQNKCTKRAKAGIELDGSEGDDTLFVIDGLDITYHIYSWFCLTWSVIYSSACLYRAIMTFDSYEKGICCSFITETIASIAFVVAFFTNIQMSMMVSAIARALSMLVSLAYFCISCYLLHLGQAHAFLVGYTNMHSYRFLWVMSLFWCFVDGSVQLIGTFVAWKLAANL